MKDVAIYCRESTEKQEIDTLVSLCIKEAEKLGYKDYIIYKDVQSGYSSNREEYLKMLEDIKAGKIKVLILYESSRLTRDELEHQLVYRLFKEKGIKIYTVAHGWVDLSNEDDIFLSSLLNLLDAREGRKTAKRVKDRMKEIAENGYWTGGPAPMGYKLIDKKLVIDEEQAIKVKEIFNLYLEGNRREYIARLYGLERKKVIRILKNPIYIGKLKYHSAAKINGKQVETENYTILDGKHEPIISNDVFELVQRKIKNTKREFSNETYIFQDLLYCPCGNKLYYRKFGATYKEKTYPVKIYTCALQSEICLKKAIKEEELLIEVLKSLENIVENFDFSEISENDKVLEEIKKYKKQQEQCKKKVEILTKNLLNGFINQELFEKFINENKENENFYNRKISALENIIKQNQAKQTNSKIIKEYFEKIKKEKNPKRLNDFLKIIIDRIEFINEFRICIHLRL